MSIHKGITPPDVLVLIAAQFNELAVIMLHNMLFEQHLSVLLVSVLPGLVRGMSGITIHADSYLSAGSALVSCSQQLVVVAGDEACAAQTLSDPRTHHLITAVLQNNGCLAAMTQAGLIVRETGLYRAEWADRIWEQRGVETAVFIQQLVTQLISMKLNLNS